MASDAGRQNDEQHQTQAPNELEAAIGIIIVDHGSRREKSNSMLLDLVALYKEETEHPIVEPAHMEIAEPSIGTAWDRCIEQGARSLILHPYFLLPGKHWAEDIPRLAAGEAARYPGVRYLITAPLGLHAGMRQVIQSRIDYCRRRERDRLPACDVCAREPNGTCQWQTSPEPIP